MPGTRRLPRLPACQMCHQRKVKCDNARPKCAPCIRGGHECVVFKTLDDKVISRRYLNELEQRELALTAEIRALENGNEDDADSISSTVSEPEVSGRSGISARTPSATLEGGGFNFMTLLFKDAEWRRNNSDLLQTLGKVTRVSDTPAESNPLPSLADAQFLFQKYLEGSHIQNPLLLRRDVQSLFTRVFPSSQRHSPGATSRDLFRVFMIFAIGSVIPYRLGSHQHHPFGYYLSAMHHFDTGFLTKGLESIQDLLLVCRFGIFHHIGTSIWDTIQLCGRLCIEQGLHKPAEVATSLLEEQLRRRVFWQYYMIDRYSSTTLNRPFAIADRDIKISFPAEADDEVIEAAEGIFADLDTFRSTHHGVDPYETQVFLLCVRLRQISSRIHAEFSQFLKPASSMPITSQQPFLLTGHVYTILDQLLQSLNDWRNSAPVYEHPRSLYETQEWYDLLQAREQLHLVRKAVDLAPKRNGIPSKSLVTLCLQSATRTIRLYSDMFQKRLVTYTRSYFHMMFTAGLSVMFCISVSTDLDQYSAQEALDILTVTEDTLTQMGAKMVDAKHYVTAFEALHRNISKKMSQTYRLAPNETGATIPTLSGPKSSHSVNIQHLSPSQLQNQTQHHHIQMQSNYMNEDSMRGAMQSFSPLPTQFNNNITSPSLNLCESHSIAQHESDIALGGDPLQWAFPNDDMVWNIQAGLSEYVCGDPGEMGAMFSSFDFGL